ncbi:Dirigent protein 3 [Linum perenne]
MASKLILHCFLTITTILLSSTSSISAAKKTDSFSKKLTRQQFGDNKEQKFTRLHFYMNDIFGGENATSIPVTKILDNDTFFGGMFLSDNALTSGPELNSTPVGRARGIFTFPSPNDFVLEMVYSLAFTRGKYNGSTLTMVGPIFPLEIPNELSIVGGTGVFRLARGYVFGRRVVRDLNAFLAVRELNVYVSHY